MPDRDRHRRKADELLRKAAEAINLAERSRLITEATRHHMLAVEAELGPPDNAETSSPRPDE